MVLIKPISALTRISDADDADATSITGDRKMFVNPRGLKRYYVVFVNESSMGYGKHRIVFYNSTDGESWNYSGLQIDGLRTADIDSEYTVDVAFIEDAPNSRLLVYASIKEDTTENIGIYCYAINDTETGFIHLWNNTSVETPDDDDIHFPEIELDDDGYLWLLWSQEYTRGGKQRARVYTKHTQNAYPTSTPSWSNSILVYDGDVTIASPIYFPVGSMGRLSAMADIALVYYVQEDVTGAEFYARTSKRAIPTSGNPIMGTVVDIDGGMSVGGDVCSVVVETGINSDVFIAWMQAGNLRVDKWDISANTSSQFGANIRTQASGYYGFSMTLNQTANPDELFIAWVSMQINWEEIIYWNVSNVTIADWSSKTGSLEYTNRTRLTWVQTPINAYNVFIQIMFTGYESGNSEIMFFEIPILPIEHVSLEANITQVNDLESFELNLTTLFNPNTTSFINNTLSLDSTGLDVIIKYINGTGFSEENDPSNYIFLDVGSCYKTDIDITQYSLIYVLYIRPNITKEGWFNVTSLTFGSKANDTYVDVFNLTIRKPQAPNRLYGAGFQDKNTSESYVQLYWNHTGSLVTGYEIENSTDKISWGLLGNSIFDSYIDNEVLNYTQRYYRVRAIRSTGVGQKNSSYTDINYEEVIFIPGSGVYYPIALYMFLMFISCCVVVAVWGSRRNA